MEVVKNLIGMFNVILLSQLETILSIILLVVQVVIIFINIYTDYKNKKRLKVEDYEKEIENLKDTIKNLKEFKKDE